MATQTKYRSRNNNTVASCSTLFHEAIKRIIGNRNTISHHPRVCEGGAKPPRYSLFMKHLLILTILVLSILFSTPVNATPLWLESRMDAITLWFTPPSQKALLASNTALERAMEISEDEEEALEQIYTIQELLTVIEQNLNVQGSPYKALRTQQEIERRLRLLQETISQLDQKHESEHYKLVILHASLRVNLLLKETELAKEKTKVKLESEKKTKV